ncbi:MAG: argininosuccinate lyase [Desulfovibrio sp.]|nr:argininosuccinate lyase [Desulfovibrio sp.]
MGTNQSWGGRFTQAPDTLVAQFTDSQTYDRILYRQDILASQAHARMLGTQGVLTQDEAKTLIEGLSKVLAEIEAGKFTWRASLEDVHMNIEARLTELVGSVGKKLHTGRSRNDQVGLTFRLFVADEMTVWQDKLRALIETLCTKAKAEQTTLLPGLTHLQPAQPICLAHHLLAYAWMFKRDCERIDDAKKRVRISPLGAAALAGTTYPLNPYEVAKDVGFPAVYPNSLDAVSDRDFVIEALSCASILMMHCSRLCEEFILWAHPSFAFLTLPDAYATGSSIMPQKKNPDVCELVRGKSGRVYGHLLGILTVMKGLPLAYNRDMQEDKEGFFDTTTTVINSLGVLTGLITHLTFRRDRMLAACKQGFLNATELADYLTQKGLPFREAHHVTGRAVALAESKGVCLEDLDLPTLQSLDPRIAEDVYPVLDPKTAVARRETLGGTGPVSVAKQIEDLTQWLNHA